MKCFKKSFSLLVLLTSIIGSQTFAQNMTFASNQELVNFGEQLKLKAERAREIKEERAKEVMQDNEYTSNGYEEGIFFNNPLMLDGNPLDYGEFTLFSAGELTVTKGDAITGQATQIPFYVYLRRNGNKVLIPGMERLDPTQIKIDVSEILQYAERGDQLVIEAVRKEDGPAKRILKLLGPGC